MKFKQYLKMIDNDNFKMKMNIDFNGEEFKSMEVEFVRQ